MKRFIKKLTLFDSMMSTVTDPHGTMEHLLIERSPPPYIFSILVSLIALLFLPIWLFQYTYEIQPADLQMTYSLCLSVALSGLFFTLFLTLILRVLGVSAPYIKILAGSVYSLTPIVPMLIAYYIGNWYTMGRLTVIGYFLTGRRAQGDWFLNLFPTFFLITEVLCFLVFTQAIRVLGKMTFLSAILSSVLSLTLLLGAFFVSTTISESLYPDTAPRVWKYVSSISDVPPQH